MGSKRKIALLIPGLLAILLFISSEVAARDFQEGKVVQEANDAKLIGGGGGFFPGGNFGGGGGFFPGFGGGFFPGFRGFNPRFCRLGCCYGDAFRGCFRCCQI